MAIWGRIVSTPGNLGLKRHGSIPTDVEINVCSLATLHAPLYIHDFLLRQPEINPY